MNHVVNFASHLEDAALKQAEATATMPFIYPHVALMPDAHFGLGSSVGTVFGTKGAIIPAAVGVDIGCGMIGVCTNYTASDLEGRDLVTLRDYIERVIPLSPGNYNSTTLKETAKVKVAELEELAERDGVDLSHSPTWKRQLGSLGGGNHFIELCLDELDRVWMFLHSGSRGVGNKIAQKHIKIAQAECKNEDLPDKDLAYLTEGTEEFESYIKELNWAQRFAFLNREEMMDRFARELGFFVDKQLEEVERINCHHNYTVREEHYGETIWLTRKGAVLADEGTPALIPGSMGTASYVVSGKGNAEALRSAPHGAGRRMSRNQAKKRFSTADLDSRMAGIVYRPGKEWIDEIPDAYKDIDQVMADAADLVTIRHKLRQIVNVKGT
ncbi:transferase [Corynebacterium glutamicum]|uniref:RtcB family protein n=1 Tax=Corynebacterium glutamicum TaxID=1718 RepID=UPI0004F63803|nr:RtcB family protein [Corynebacterium glutamicum]AIK86374.1 transferase [Corynebacterium glutamicum]AIK89158.1 transferase [Corynebacterium glutamicum]AMA01368.1 RNA-splicing ligase RtcB [Corynebacterium glutamicum]QDQ19531.1 RtcB family protein [Corynebacterium glutamicum]QDQ23096.1 RtcB family protein [Corynebacterium glutamicum]